MSDERWTEIDVDHEGISVTLYEQNDRGDPIVVDEWYAFWDTIEHRKVVLDDGTGVSEN